MLQLAYSPSPEKQAAWTEGFVKAFAGTASPVPGDDVGLDHQDAFNEGVIAGLDAQTNGIDLGLDCIASNADPDSETVVTVLEDGERLGGIAHALNELKFGAFAETALVSLVLTILTNPVSGPPVDQSLPSLQQPLLDQLTAMGLQNFLLFCGIGIDNSSEECALKITPFYKTQDLAQQGASGFGRPTTTVVSWRTDQCGGFAVVA